jgi:hypothetical protein
MEAFRAANPGCVFADFVRWHSPKDWRAEDSPGDNTSQVRGRLSKRFEGTNNLWWQMWGRARAVPVHQQVALFKPEVEAEQVLNYLEHIEPAQLFAQLSHISLANCVGVLARTEGAVVGVPCIRRGVSRCLSSLRRDAPLLPAICDELKELEILCGRAVSLSSTFTSTDLVELILVLLLLIFRKETAEFFVV